jgi:hypothetical protein
LEAARQLNFLVRPGETLSPEVIDMRETFTDPETGWIVSRETVVRSGVELVRETLTDPQTGQVHEGGLRSPQIQRDIGAWVRSIVGQTKRPASGPSTCRRVVLMVQELHKLGYGRLRLAPGMAPSGMHWRGNVSPVSNISRQHGARTKDFRSHVARCTSGQGAQFFGWSDAEDDSPAELAAKFLARFPDLAALGCGSDPEYERWYAEMVRATAPEGLVYAYSDWDDTDSGFLPALGMREEVRIPLPPPGEADCNEQWA